MTEQKQVVDGEIRDMISALTRRLAHLHHHVHTKSHGGGGSSRHDDDDQTDHHDHGFGIITLAGTNTGATMRGELSDDIQKPSSSSPDGSFGEHEHESPLAAFVNSNIQAINNSLMLGGSYSTDDPGVHMDVGLDTTPPMEHHAATAAHDQKKQGKNKGKKKSKETAASKSNNHYSDY